MTPRITSTTHARPPGGGGVVLLFAFNGLNFAILAMVAPGLARAAPGLARAVQESKWMTRRNCLWLALALAGCGKEPELPPDLFPESVSGAWHRVAVHDLAASDSPDPVPRNEIARLREAAYDGPGKLQARVYQLRSDAVGLELAQRWRPSSDTVFFDVGRYFVVIKWQSADRQALRDFVRDLETRLGTALRRKS